MKLIIFHNYNLSYIMHTVPLSINSNIFYTYVNHSIIFFLLNRFRKLAVDYEKKFCPSCICALGSGHHTHNNNRKTCYQCNFDSRTQRYNVKY